MEVKLSLKDIIEIFVDSVEYIETNTLIALNALISNELVDRLSVDEEDNIENDEENNLDDVSNIIDGIDDFATLLEIYRKIFGNNTNDDRK